MLPRLRYDLGTTVVFVIIIFSSMLVAQTSELAVQGLSDRQARRAVNGWKADNKDFVHIQRGTEGELLKSLTGPNDVLGSLSLTGKPTGDFIVGSYLYDLRDRKYADMGSPSFSKDLKIQLGPADVEAFSFRKYVQGLGSALANPGALSVASVPPGASIMIDSEPQGATNKDFVVSKGKHSISVKSTAQSCADTVDVEDDLVVFKCPK